MLYDFIETVWDIPLTSLEGLLSKQTVLWCITLNLPEEITKDFIATPWLHLWTMFYWQCPGFDLHSEAVLILALYAIWRDWEFSNPGNCLFVSWFCLLFTSLLSCFTISRITQFFRQFSTFQLLQATVLLNFLLLCNKDPLSSSFQ